MYVDSDSSLYYETTYSEDERIAKAIQEKRNARKLRAEMEDLEREKLFETFQESDLDMFKLPGLKLHTFRRLKIKFSFRPSEITNLVNKNVVFYVSLRYRNKHWRVKRDSLPANYKWRMYKLFYDRSLFAIDDENVIKVLIKIYEILVAWADHEENFRLKKFEKYKKNEEVELDSDDEQLFLSAQERIQLYQKRVKVLRRMVPPDKRIKK